MRSKQNQLFPPCHVFIQFSYTKGEKGEGEKDRRERRIGGREEKDRRDKEEWRVVDICMIYVIYWGISK